jgi:hypothetical protein
MNNTKQIVATAAVVICIGMVLLLSGCDAAGAGDSVADDATTPVAGSVSVALSGATVCDDEVLYAFLYAAGEKSIYTDQKLLAVNYGTICGGSASFVLKVDDGAWEPSSTDWIGTAGTSYDLYLYTDGNEDGDKEPVTHNGSNPAYRAASYPQSLTINGNQTVSVALSEMVEYSGGTLDMTVTGGATGPDPAADIMFFGVFLDGASPGADDPVGFCEDQTFTGTSTTTTGLVRAISDEDTDPDTIWYGVDGTVYDVYLFVDLGGVNGGSSDGPNPGDKMYQLQYTHDGNVTRTVALGDFATME